MSPTPVWFITAASSGFGRQLTLEALSRGHTVVATARNPAKIQDLAEAGAHTMALDVTSPLQVIEAVAAEVFARFGRVDYLLNAAGYILQGAVEEVSPQEVYNVFNTNVFGALNTIRSFLPRMREQEVDAGAVRATVATFGSLGSWQCGADWSIYAMTKHACSALGESLAHELAPFGIRATAIEPGYFRTGFLNAGTQANAALQLPVYNDEATPTGQFRKIVSQIDGNQPGDVVRGCRVIVDVLTGTGIAQGRQLPVRIALGSDCEKTIREECAAAVSIMDEWKDVIRSTDYPKGQ